MEQKLEDVKKNLEGALNSLAKLSFDLVKNDFANVDNLAKSQQIIYSMKDIVYLLKELDRE